MSKTYREKLAELEDDLKAHYKIEPSFNVTSDGHIEAYDKAMEIVTKQIGGNHYVAHTIQPWDIIDNWSLDYYLGNVIKYVLRDKNDKVEDLHKAIHYLEKKIELLEQE